MLAENAVVYLGSEPVKFLPSGLVHPVDYQIDVLFHIEVISFGVEVAFEGQGRHFISFKHLLIISSFNKGGGINVKVLS